MTTSYQNHDSIHTGGMSARCMAFCHMDREIEDFQYAGYNIDAPDRIPAGSTRYAFMCSDKLHISGRCIQRFIDR